MKWMFQYRIKGANTILKETIELDLVCKWSAINWWKLNNNRSQDKALINCSDSGDLKIEENKLIGMDLKIKIKNVKE